MKTARTYEKVRHKLTCNKDAYYGTDTERHSDYEAGIPTELGKIVCN